MTAANDWTPVQPKSAASTNDWGPVPTSTKTTDDWSPVSKTASPSPIATPHQYDTAFQIIAQKHDIDPNLLREVGYQESGLGTSAAYDPITGLSRSPGNQGHGWFQLDPASGASPQVLSEASSDPAFAANYAAGMLQNALHRAGGDVRRALAIYNSGDPNSPKGLAYADQVLGRRLDPLQANTGPKLSGKPPIPTPGPTQKTPAGTQTLDPSTANLRLSQANDPIVRRAMGAMETIGAYFEGTTLNSPVLGPALTSQFHKGGVTGALPPPYSFAVALTDPKVRKAYGDIIKAAVAGKLSPTTMAQLDDRYGLFGLQSLEAAHRADPDNALFSYLAKHPTVSQVGLRGAADMLSLSPGALLRGGLKPLGKVPGVAKAAEAIKTAARPVTRPLARVFDPHAFIREAAHDRGVSPEVAEASTRRYMRSRGVASAQTAKISDQIFGHTTLPQRIEIERRSEGLPPNTNVSEPKGPSLDERAVMHRTTIRSMTDDQLARALIDKSRVFDVNQYTPRFGARGSVYQVADHDDVAAFYGQGSRARVGSKGTAGAQGGHKVYETYDQAKASGNLSPAYDPRDNMQKYLLQRGARVAMSDALSEILQMSGFEHPLVYRDAQGNVLGRGEEGQEEMGRVAARAARAKAFTEAQQQTGISQKDLASYRRQNPTQIARQLGEAERAKSALPQKLGERVEQKVTAPLEKRAQETLESHADVELGKREPSLAIPQDRDAAAAARAFNRNREAALSATKVAVSKTKMTESARAAKTVAAKQVGDHITDALFGNDTKLSRRIKNLQDKLATAKVGKAEAVRFQKIFDQQLRGLETSIKQQMQRAAENEAKAAGYVPGSDVARQAGISLPQLADHLAIPHELADFLKEQGANPDDADGFAAFWDGINKLYRVGIIQNPARHVGINMPIAYMASGGSPARLTEMFRSPEPLDLQEAAHYGAIHEGGVHSLFGGSPGTVFSTPLRKVFGESAEKTGAPKSLKGYAAGARTLADAAASRAWAANQKLVFDVFETRLATERYKQYRDQFIREGMDPEAAKSKSGKETRKVFGDKEGINQKGVERMLNQTMLFYGWIKSQIPLMLRAMVERPQWVWTPYAEIQRWNEARHDPNLGNESDGTIYLGQWNGQDQYLSFPGAQKYIDMMLNVFAPKGDLGAPLQEHLRPLENFVTSELRPFPYGIAAQQVETLAGRPQEPGAPNFGTQFNLAAPLPEQVGQYAGAFGRDLPGVEPIQGALQFGQTAMQGSPSTLLSLASLYPYAKESPAVQKAIEHPMNEYNNFATKIEADIRQLRSQPMDDATRNKQITILRLQKALYYYRAQAATQAAQLQFSIKDPKKLQQAVTTIMQQLQARTKGIAQQIQALNPQPAVSP